MQRKTHGFALFLATCLATGSALADEKEEAEQRFRAGVALQKLEDWDAAVVEFQASLRLYRTKGALFNLANALRATHRYVEALEALNQLEREYGQELDPQMKAAAQRLTNELRNLTGSLVIEVSEEGADVHVDGELVGKTPLTEPIRLSVGNHSVDVTLDGYAPTSVDVDLASREERTETITLRLREPEPAPPPTTPPPPAASPPLVPPPSDAAEETPGTGLRTTAWVATGTGVALLAAGTATGVWALVLDGDLEEDCVDEHCPGDRAGDIERLDRLVPTTNALLAIGAVATATGVTLLVANRARRHDRAQRVHLVAGPRFIGTSVRGTF